MSRIYELFTDKIQVLQANNVDIYSPLYQFGPSLGGLLALLEEDAQEILDYSESDAEELGYTHGHDSGYDAGYEVGVSEGYSEGYGEGYTEGHSEGREEGDEEGYARGSDDGRESGFEDGCIEGYSNWKYGKDEG